MRAAKVGHRYRHFKGKEYVVLHLAKDSETHGDLVVYKAVYGDEIVWVRPLTMFLEQVMINGKKINRFEEVQSFHAGTIPATDGSMNEVPT